MIQGIQDILINQGIDEPILLGIISMFLSKCPPLDEDLQIGGGLDNMGNQFVIIEIGHWQLVLTMEYPFIKGYVANLYTTSTHELDFSPNVTKEIKNKGLDKIFSYFSTIALIFANVKMKFGDDLVTEEQFKEIYL